MENDFISVNTSNGSYWIGLKKVANHMRWINDNSKPSHAHWENGQPLLQNGTNDCAYIKSEAWRIGGCDQRIMFVCEKGKIKRITRIKKQTLSHLLDGLFYLHYIKFKLSLVQLATTYTANKALLLLG